MVEKHKISLQLLVVVEEDGKNGFYTATCAQFPEVVAQGKTPEEAIHLMMELLPFALQDRENDAMKMYEGKSNYSTQKIDIPVYA